MPPRQSKAKKSGPTGPLRLSMAAENYLLSIFQLEEQGLHVTPTQLAEQLKRLPEGEGLGTSLPSVSGMLRRLVREGLIDMSKNKEIELTDPGRTAAESMVRRHRLAELLVVEVLGVELHKSHVEAHRLEHAMSPELEEKIRIKLGNPQRSPFGDPIPGSGYELPRNSRPLSQSREGERYIIDRIPEDDQTLLEYLVPLNVIPGKSIEITEAAPYRGVIRMSCGGSEVVVGYEVAERIWIHRGEA